MRNDHFVSQTYLKNFADERGLLHSDNPAALLDPGEAWASSSPFHRILPITPHICIGSDLSKLDRRFNDPKARLDFNLPPAGTLKGVKADAELVGVLNAGVAMCADDLVLSCRPSDYVRDLTARHAKHRLQAETMELSKGAATTSAVGCVPAYPPNSPNGFAFIKEV